MQVIGHIADVDCVHFLRRCAEGLRPGGVVVLKDNTAGDQWTFVVDRSDSSMSRSLPFLKLLFKLAGLQVCGHYTYIYTYIHGEQCYSVICGKLILYT